jgi:hypothetical protein
MFAGIEKIITEFVVAAKVKSETLQTDEEIFDVWASFVAVSERLGCFRPTLPPRPTAEDERQATQGLQLVRAGRDLVSYVVRARVPMPKSTCEYVERCRQYIATYVAPVVVHVPVERTGPVAPTSELQPERARQQSA